MVQHADLSVYLHIPFCQKRCVYCDYYTCTSVPASVRKQYIHAVLNELHRRLERLHWPAIQTLYIGGGTPSHLEPETLHTLLDRLSDMAGPVRELTLEANPESVSQEFLSLCNTLYPSRSQGHQTTRISLGIQTFHDTSLRLLGRAAASQDNIRALELLRDHWQSPGHQVNIDLLSGLWQESDGETLKNPPSDSSPRPLSDLARTLGWNPDHVTLYELTLEPGTKLADARQYKAARETLPPEETRTRHWKSSVRYLEHRAWQRYSQTQFARRGKQSLHTLRQGQMQPLLGVGPGAVSTLKHNNSVLRQTDTPDLARWMADPPGARTTEALDADTLALEYIINGLSTNRGLDTRAFHTLFGINLLHKASSLLERWQNIGALTLEAGRIIPTSTGLDLSRSLNLDLASVLEIPPGLPVPDWPLPQHI